jgi:hypothetical protein
MRIAKQKIKLFLCLPARGASQKSITVTIHENEIKTNIAGL